MTFKALARRYAVALFAVAKKAGTTEAAGRDLSGIRDMVGGHDQLRQVFLSSGIPPQKKRAVLDAVLSASGPVSPDVHRLLLLLADRDRLALVPDIDDVFAELSMSARRVQLADIVTASPLSDARRTAVAEALSRASGCEVTVTARVDPAIIGGIVARVGSVVYDGSVTRQLEKMRQRLLE